MMIYNLIFICVMTMLALLNVFSALQEDDAAHFLISLVITICGVLAIVFQSINL